MRVVHYRPGSIVVACRRRRPSLGFRDGSCDRRWNPARSVQVPQSYLIRCTDLSSLITVLSVESYLWNLICRNLIASLPNLI